jgi:hypothetical protein
VPLPSFAKKFGACTVSNRINRSSQAYFARSEVQEAASCSYSTTRSHLPFHEREMYGESSDLRSFTLWFQSHEGFVDASVMDITTFPGHGGRGAIALTEIPV